MKFGKCERFLLRLVIVASVSVTCLEFKYHTHDELTEFLKNFIRSHTNFFSRLYSIGRSVKGKELWVVEVSAQDEIKLGIPNVKLIGNIHGNEPAGREILLHLLEYLAEEYTNNNATIRWLMENTRLHILPSMNPDGFETSSMGVCVGDHGRSNAKYTDLNRNFPDYYKANIFPPQPESLAVQKWMERIPFVLSASLHGGALVVNYPFDTVKELKWEKLLKDLSAVTTGEEETKLRQDYIVSLANNTPSKTPDDDVFVHLAKTYSNKHPSMHMGYPCPESSDNFTGGITNGAAWYPFRGGMQDYNYFKHGCMELTLEISCCKYPHSKKLSKIWTDNKWALIDLIVEAHKGVSGQILDYYTKEPVPYATLKIVGRQMNFTSTATGEFWRILLPGSYRIEIQAWGYHPKRVAFTVRDYKDVFPKPTFLQIHLRSLRAPKSTTTSESPTIPSEASTEISETTTPIFIPSEASTKISVPTTPILIPTTPILIPTTPSTSTSTSTKETSSRTPLVTESTSSTTESPSSTTPIIKESPPRNETDSRTFIQKESLNNCCSISGSAVICATLIFTYVKLFYF